jgi:hypothetical protein
VPQVRHDFDFRGLRKHIERRYGFEAVTAFAQQPQSCFLPHTRGILKRAVNPPDGLQ